MGPLELAVEDHFEHCVVRRFTTGIIGEVADVSGDDGAHEWVVHGLRVPLCRRPRVIVQRVSLQTEGAVTVARVDDRRLERLTTVRARGHELSTLLDRVESVGFTDRLDFDARTCPEQDEAY